MGKGRCSRRGVQAQGSSMAARRETSRVSKP